jgi:hypothetical protein
VQIKPGYPLAFGRLGVSGALVFGLPGNPVSAMVTFEEFVRPALRKLTGHTALFRPLVRARLAERLAKKPGRMHFVRVGCHASAAGSSHPTGNRLRRAALRLRGPAAALPGRGQPAARRRGRHGAVLDAASGADEPASSAVARRCWRYTARGLSGGRLANVSGALLSAARRSAWA